MSDTSKPTQFPSDALTEWVRENPYALRFVFIEMARTSPNLLLEIVTQIGSAPDELITYLEGLTA